MKKIFISLLMVLSFNLFGFECKKLNQLDRLDYGVPQEFKYIVYDEETTIAGKQVVLFTDCYYQRKEQFSETCKRAVEGRNSKFLVLTKEGDVYVIYELFCTAFKNALGNTLQALGNGLQGGAK